MRGTMTALDTSNLHGDWNSILGLEYSSVTNKLYGYAWERDSQEEHMLSIDPVSGVVSSMGVIPGVQYVRQLSAMVGSEYFSIMVTAEGERLLHISVSNDRRSYTEFGSAGMRGTMTALDTSNLHGDWNSILGLEYSSVTNKLYGYAWERDSQEEHMLSIDPVSGVVLSMGVIPGVQYVRQVSAMVGTEYYS